MEKYDHIEFVDELNTISSLAGDLTSKALYENGLLKGIEVSSSGVLVGPIKSPNNTKLARALSPYMGHLVKNNILDAKDEKMFLDLKDPTVLNQVARDLRSSQKKTMKILYDNKTKSARLRQTRSAVPDAGLVIAMSNQAMEKAFKIYHTSENSPKIIPLYSLSKIIYQDPFPVEVTSCKENLEKVREIMKGALEEFLG